MAYFIFRDSTWEAEAEGVAVAGMEVQAPLSRCVMEAQSFEQHHLVPSNANSGTDGAQKDLGLIIREQSVLWELKQSWCWKLFEIFPFTWINFKDGCIMYTASKQAIAVTRAIMFLEVQLMNVYLKVHLKMQDTEHWRIPWVNWRRLSTLFSQMFLSSPCAGVHDNHSLTLM